MKSLDNRISIIIPAYNADKTIDKCLNSILKQSYQNIEIIIVNDGSTDDTYSICCKYAERYSNLIVIDMKNEGVSKARNTGLMRACGDWILFLDADDYVDSNFCNVIYDANNADLIICSYADVYDKKIVKNTYRKAGYSNSINGVGELIGVSNLAYVWGKFYKKEIIDKHFVSFNESLDYGEDNIFVLTYCKYISSCFVTKNKFYFFTHKQEGSLSKQYVDNIDEFIKLFNNAQSELYERYPSYKTIYYSWNLNETLYYARMKLRNIYRRNSTYKTKKRQETYISVLLRELKDNDFGVTDMCHSKADYVINILLKTKNVKLIRIVSSKIFSMK